jgi:hypothetical protein
MTDEEEFTVALTIKVLLSKSDETYQVEVHNEIGDIRSDVFAEILHNIAEHFASGDIKRVY